MNARDEHWIERSRELLEVGVHSLSPGKVARLVAAREAALLAARPRGSWRTWCGAAIATTCGVLLALTLGSGARRELLPAPLSPRASDTARIDVADSAEVPPTSLEAQALSLSEPELALISAADDFILLEDLEFYAWLEGADHEG